MMKYYTSAEVAEMLKVTKSALRQWKASGKIKATKIGSKCVRYSEQQIADFLATYNKTA